MGLTPGYVFRFVIGERSGDGIIPVAPKRDLSTRAVEDEDFQWLADRFLGGAAVRAAEISEEDTMEQSKARSC